MDPHSLAPLYYLNKQGILQDVPKELMELAMQSSWFKNSRFKRGRGKGCRASGDRLGLGASSADSGGGADGGGQQYAFGDPDAGRCVALHQT